MHNHEQIEIIKKWLGAGSINIFGLPFAGKDIQGQRLAKIFDGNLIGAGEIFRSDNMPKNVKECMHNGKIVPTEDFVNIVLPYLSQQHLTGKPLILSSVGRWHGEEDGVIEAIKTSGHPLKMVIYLDISRDDVFHRWQQIEIHKDRSERPDNSEEVITTRLSEFKEKTLPVLDYYRNLGELIEIDGKGSKDEVTQNIINGLIERSKNS
jgi:adenylate kinase